MAKKKLRYSEAINEIEEILETIESQELDVDDLSEKVKRVSELIQLCKTKLHTTEDEVRKILDSINTNE